MKTIIMNNTRDKARELIRTAMALNNFHPDEPFESVAHVFSKGKLYRPTQLEMMMADELDESDKEIERLRKKLVSADNLYKGRDIYQLNTPSDYYHTRIMRMINSIVEEALDK